MLLVKGSENAGWINNNKILLMNEFISLNKYLKFSKFISDGYKSIDGCP